MTRTRTVPAIVQDRAVSSAHNVLRNFIYFPLFRELLSEEPEPPEDDVVPDGDGAVGAGAGARDGIGTPASITPVAAITTRRSPTEITEPTGT